MSDPLSLLTAAAAEHPGRVAVSAADGRLTFAELLDRVAGLAGALTERHVGPGDRVGVHLPRGVDLVPVLLATWWAGAAFVPLDPDLPAARLARMAGVAAVRVVVSADRHVEWSDAPVIPPDATAGPVPVVPAAPDDSAYVMFTSGSTGLPKGVEVTRGGVATLLASLTAAGVWPTGPRVVACNASVSFDASVQQWLRVCRGDTVHVLDADTRTDVVRLAECLRDNVIEDLDATPTHWASMRELLFLGDGVTPLRLYLGGEPITPAMWADLSDLVRRGLLERVVNLYGPTECTVDVTAAEVSGDEPHIGGALPGRRLLVLDDRLRPVGQGVVGELYVGGALARGYVDAPAQTATRFVADPGGAPGERVYRTGDRVRWRPDGTLDYLGRVDRQVKVRGHRVELGEVEAVLGSLPGVYACVVSLWQDQLIAHYQTGPGSAVPAEQVRSALAARLPTPMVPAAVVPVPELPLTPAGKVDVAALPRPARERPADSPADPVLALVAEVWAEVLGVDHVSADDDFFALGGHSLVALRVVSEVRKEIGVVVPTLSVYRHPVLSDLVRHIEGLLAAEGLR